MVWEVGLGGCWLQEIPWNFLENTSALPRVVKISRVWVPCREYPRLLCCSIVFFPFFVAIFPAVLSVQLFRALQSSLQISSLASADQFLLSFSSLDSQSFPHFSPFFLFPSIHLYYNNRNLCKRQIWFCDSSLCLQKIKVFLPFSSCLHFKFSLLSII